MWKHALYLCVMQRTPVSKVHLHHTLMQQVPHLLWWHLGCPTGAGQLEPTKTWHFQTRWAPWAMLCACQLSLLSAQQWHTAGWSSRCFCHTTPSKRCSAGTLHPLELQRLAYLSSYFNLLQLVCFYFFILSNSSCCVGVYTSQMCTNAVLLNAINTLYAYTYIYLLWPEPAGLCASQNNDAIRSYLFIF